MLHKAFRDSREWLEKKPDFTVSVNISVLQFLEDHFLEDLYRIIEEEAFSCENLIVELTESYAVKNMEIFREKFNDMRSRNIRTALDDFGTGYSSLNHLTKLPIDVLKIDRSFVIDMAENDKSRYIVENIIQLSHKLGMTVVAEGVEEKEQVDYLRSIECDTVQGFYYSKPEYFENIISMLSK